MDIVEEIAVEASKNNEVVADVNARMSPSRNGQGIRHFYFFPLLEFHVKAINVTHVLIVSPSDNDQLRVVHYGAGMAPSC